MRPLDRIPSMKLKLGILIVVAVLVSALVSTVGFRIGLPVWLRPVVAGAIALLFVQVLARGMTAPLRDMARAAIAMRDGDYGRRIATDSRDEVGQLALAFNDMATQLAEVDRLRRDLVANASHELRTPLSGLQATLENMVDGITPAGHDELRGMLAQVERMGDLVAQLLDLSRLESGDVGLDLVPVDLRTVGAQAVADLSGLAAQGGIELLPPCEGAPVVVHGDGVRLRQVAVNLVSNAIRHTPRGGTVRIEVEGSTAPRMVVHDDGPGIPATESERIFERFYRADRARGGGGGAGLGLAICRWIVELHGGRVGHDPTAPGCRMVVDLPAGTPTAV